jgi:hypothetical protein
MLQGEFVKWRWSKDELETQWSLSPDELALLPSRTDSGRLGFAISLKFFQFQGFFPGSEKDIPHEIAVYLAQATNSAVANLDVYEWDGRTGQRHRRVHPNKGTKSPTGFSPFQVSAECSFLSSLIRSVGK